LSAADWAIFNGKQAAITPAALTKVDDTNVTLTLGGSPTTALLQAASITAGWSGTLADARITSAATWNAKQDAITLTTTGTSGAATLTGATLNIPQYSGGSGGSVLKSTTDGASITGTTLTISSSQLVTASTYSVGDIIRITSRARKVGNTNNAVTIRVYVNSTNSLTAALLVATLSITGATLPILRHLAIKSATNSEVNSSTTSLTNDVTTGSSAAVSNLNIDWTVNQYMIFTLQNAVGTDTSVISFYLIEKL
jgi:acyl-CoA hydrolase